ncbi:hypothetical protein VaNZ11_006658 [Volvox africanus]|uniref:TPM domain-containing protein n=1 Tax=Volvox africanus TaxID=51714 RepID=A0ABQ5S180_9CHLO|nr:hypothetical protein VaNZ11_006658 [Volvox africanus]
MSLLMRAACLSGLKWHLLEAGYHFQFSSAGSASKGSLHRAIRALCTSAAPEESEDVAAMRRYRDSKSFRRRFDGRLLLHGKESNTWMEAKLDGYVEGSLLLLGQDGLVYYLVSEDLKQIDLSNDQLVGQLFGEGSWEKLMQPLYTQLAGGELKHVRMTPQQFRSIFTVLREAPPPAQS